MTDKEQILLALGAQPCRFCENGRATKRAYFQPQNGELPEEDEIVFLCEDCAAMARLDPEDILLILGDA